MATVVCHIVVRKRRITFEVQGCYTMFCHMEEKVICPNSSLLDKFPPSPEIDMEGILNCEAPPDFHWSSIEDPNQRYVKVGFTTHMAPNMPKVEAHACNESAISDYYRFAEAILSFAPIEGFDVDFDLGVEQGNSSQSNGLRKRVCLIR